MRCHIPHLVPERPLAEASRQMPPLVGGLCGRLRHQATSIDRGGGAFRPRSDNARVRAEKPFQSTASHRLPLVMERLRHAQYV
jgi:hypothetical protein